ncbi:MAG TPA: 4-alpha-glucanotransferase [Acidimicrobiales bacterium]|nr:4-alpha-glucanotransferase [Acidimicrobiales bacterium]
MTGQPHPGTWGVAGGYHDYAGNWRDAPEATVQAMLAAMGAIDGEPPPPVCITVRTDHPLPDIGSGVIELEHGGEVKVDGPLPTDLATGYHRFHPSRGDRRNLIVSPGRVPGVPGRGWGFATQLYATRSERSWGVGDFADLRHLGAWAGGLGAGFTLVNPLHAPTPRTPLQPSPYFPGSRCFLNPIYIAVEEVPGTEGIPGLAAAAAAGRALNADRIIDRDRAWSIKEPVLRAVFERRANEGDFARYRAEKGQSLRRFALYCAVCDEVGPDWRSWPAGVVERAEPAQVLWHEWLQWVAETQLALAGARHGLVVDLAVGVDPSGPDSWIWQHTFASGMTVGAPPDEFNTRGQDWGLPPFDPWRLRTAEYEPWIAALRSGMTYGCGLRVDHVMGLFRLFWIPQGTSPAAGTYVSYPHHDMLNILALEAERAGAYVVGEDLGTVQDEVRHDLAERRVLSYRLWWFETTSPKEWPSQAMAAVTTHDLPTVAGVLTGSDLEAQRRMGTEPNEESSSALLARLRDLAPGADIPATIEAVYADLATAPCELLVATLEDALAVEERPNMPGTTDEWPNWSIALPIPLQDMEKGPLPGRLAQHLGRADGA